MRYKFSSKKRFVRCKRCGRKVERTGGGQKYCFKCAVIRRKKQDNRQGKRKYKSRGTGKCLICGRRISRRKKFCEWCQEDKQRTRSRNYARECSSTRLESKRDSNGIEQARTDLLTRRRKAVNLVDLRQLNPDKFARTVNEILADERVLAGLRK